MAVEGRFWILAFVVIYRTSRMWVQYTGWCVNMGRFKVKVARVDDRTIASNKCPWVCGRVHSVGKNLGFEVIPLEKVTNSQIRRSCWPFNHHFEKLNDFQKLLELLKRVWKNCRSLSHIGRHWQSLCYQKHPQSNNWWCRVTKRHTKL